MLLIAAVLDCLIVDEGVNGPVVGLRLRPVHVLAELRAPLQDTNTTTCTHMRVTHSLWQSPKGGYTTLVLLLLQLSRPAYSTRRLE
jgi:hypothetical protein